MQIQTLWLIYLLTIIVIYILLSLAGTIPAATKFLISLIVASLVIFITMTYQAIQVRDEFDYTAYITLMIFMYFAPVVGIIIVSFCSLMKN